MTTELNKPSLADRLRAIFILGPLLIIMPFAFVGRLAYIAIMVGIDRADAFYHRVIDRAREVAELPAQQPDDDLKRIEGEWPDEIMGLALNVQDDSARLMAYARAGDRTYTIEQLAESLINAVDPAMRYMKCHPYPAGSTDELTWLTEAHVLCNDYGITFGPLSLRLLSLRSMLEEFTNASTAKAVNHPTGEDVQQQADAWMRVAEVLSEVLPGWTRPSDREDMTGTEAAVETIRRLAAPKVTGAFHYLHSPTQARAWADSYDKQGGHALVVQMLRGYADLLEARP